jgi:hypothetical protein
MELGQLYISTFAGNPLSSRWCGAVRIFPSVAKGQDDIFCIMGGSVRSVRLDGLVLTVHRSE